jgi:hypothetical protein
MTDNAYNNQINITPREVVRILCSKTPLNIKTYVFKDNILLYKTVMIVLGCH